MTHSRRLPTLSVPGLVLFPGAVVSVELGDKSALELVNHVSLTRGPEDVPDPSLVVATRIGEGTTLEDLAPIATEAELVRVRRIAGGKVAAVVRGLGRVRLAELVSSQPFSTFQVIPVESTVTDSIRAEGAVLAVREAVRRLVAVSPEVGQAGLDRIEEPGPLSDAIAAQLELPLEERLALRAETDIITRLERVATALSRAEEVKKVTTRINSTVRDDIEKQQREAILRRQLKAIEEELGEGEDASDVNADLAERITKAGMSPEAETVARKQLTRLGQMQNASPEYSVTRTYLEWLCDVPWSAQSEDRLDLAATRTILDAEHFGLEKVKRRIVEFLAVRKLAPDKKGPILCLVGPPGVGKTSLAKSVASALGRQLVRVSLGGVRDEAEIRGHRRTYLGALPGRIVQGLKKAGVKNPVFVLDELDKLASDFRGDPASALLEVLDPEQNNSFSDHYLEVPVDLSKVLFIATANQLDTIPHALRDRLEIIEIAGYTHAEKRDIARRHLWPKQVGEHGLAAGTVTISDPALDEIIDHYTREAGVRNLERELSGVLRGLAVEVAAGTAAWPKPPISVADVEAALGPRRFESDVAERVLDPGVAVGMAWTPSGGDILFIEASKMPGKGKLILTGQLGDVMKESAQAAVSYVRSHAADLGIDPAVFDRTDLHLHVPAGATPKDGPSAGVTLFSALVSVLTDRPVANDLAMTGEITLRGQILPVGGIKSKVLAAHRAGLRRIVLPERNRKDAEEIPAEVRAELSIQFCRSVEELLPLVFGVPTAALVPPVPDAPALFPASGSA